LKHNPHSLIIAVALVALVIAGCTAPAGVALQPTTRTFYIAAIEPKGSTTVDKEPFPTGSLPEGGGYALKEPDDTGTWTVSTYRWLPSEITVMQGDTVTLELIGINGASHPATIEGYDITFEVKRGQRTSVTFIADKVGVFAIACTVHQPSMTGTLVVLPRS